MSYISTLFNIQLLWILSLFYLPLTITAVSSSSSTTTINNKDNTPSTIVKYHRYIILGAGPAGLQMAHYLQSAGRDYTVIDEVSFRFSYSEVKFYCTSRNVPIIDRICNINFYPSLPTLLLYPYIYPFYNIYPFTCSFSLLSLSLFPIGYISRFIF